MKFNNVDFDTYFKNYPTNDGYFGKYGGAYIPEELKAAMVEIRDAYQTICKSAKFIAELRRIRKGLSGQTDTGFPSGPSVPEPGQRRSAVCQA